MFNQRVALNLSGTLYIVYNLYKVDYIIILNIKNTPELTSSELGY